MKNNCRIYNYYYYKLYQISGPPKDNITLAIDETLITHDFRNSFKKKIRIDFLP